MIAPAAAKAWSPNLSTDLRTTMVRVVGGRTTNARTSADQSRRLRHAVWLNGALSDSDRWTIVATLRATRCQTGNQCRKRGTDVATVSAGDESGSGIAEYIEKAENCGSLFERKQEGPPIGGAFRNATSLSHSDCRIQCLRSLVEYYCGYGREFKCQLSLKRVVSIG